jgi:hypothetical protein
VSGHPVVVAYPALEAYVLNGDFEGYTSLALATSAKVGFRSATTARPTATTSSTSISPVHEGLTAQPGTEVATQYRVVVIGGDGTGGALAHDLALRGLAVTVVERGELTSGTTGRHHGLLHRGGRYAMTDAESAVECTGRRQEPCRRPVFLVQTSVMRCAGSQ